MEAARREGRLESDAAAARRRSRWLPIQALLGPMFFLLAVVPGQDDFWLLARELLACGVAYLLMLRELRTPAFVLGALPVLVACTWLLLRAGSWDGGEGGWGKAYQVVVVRPLRPMVPILGLYLVGLSLYWLLAVREARERRALAACVHGAERGDPARGIPPARR